MKLKKRTKLPIDRFIHIDLYSPPIDENKNWVLIRSLREWCDYVEQYGLPNFIHFGANQGPDRELGKAIIADIIYREKYSKVNIIPPYFSFSVNSSLRLFGDKFYIELNEFLVNRELLAA